MAKLTAQPAMQMSIALHMLHDNMHNMTFIFTHFHGCGPRKWK